MPTLRRLKIEKFRNVVPGTELRFHDGFNVLLGQNGTGKTNLLKLIAMALSSDFSSLEGEAFAIEYDIETGHGGIGVQIQSQPSTIPQDRVGIRGDHPTVRPEEEASSAYWSYQVHVRAPDGREHLRIEASPLGATLHHVPSAETMAIENPSPFHHSFFTRGPYRLAEQQRRLIFDEVVAFLLADATRCLVDRFDEAIGGFELMTANGHWGDRPSAPASLEVSTYRERTEAWPRRVPWDIVTHVEDGKFTIGDERLALNHKDIPFLHKTIQLCGFTDGHMILVRELFKPRQHGVDVVYSNFSFTFTLDDGTIITHKDLSYGQKRLLSFLYHLALNDDVVVADELVNGLHYDWIEACIEEIGDRQAFLTSQNPILLDFLPFESAEQVRQSFLLCKLEHREGGSVMVWKNLEQEAAEEFYRAYRTRALQVSEILRTQGLW